jgi:hypothetical protein
LQRWPLYIASLALIASSAAFGRRGCEAGESVVTQTNRGYPADHYRVEL